MTEVRATDPDTGGQKGRKGARFDLIPPRALEQVAEVFGHGAEKYEDWNWRKGYPWSWSYASLQRHLSAFWGGETMDPESGMPHVAHAAWHCLVLLTFMEEREDKDDRFVTERSKGELAKAFTEAWRAEPTNAIAMGMIEGEDEYPSEEDTTAWLRDHGYPHEVPKGPVKGYSETGRRSGW